MGEANVWKLNLKDRTNGVGNPIKHIYESGTYTVSLCGYCIKQNM